MKPANEVPETFLHSLKSEGRELFVDRTAGGGTAKKQMKVAHFACTETHDGRGSEGVAELLKGRVRLDARKREVRRVGSFFAGHAHDPKCFIGIVGKLGKGLRRPVKRYSFSPNFKGLSYKR